MTESYRFGGCSRDRRLRLRSAGAVRCGWPPHRGRHQVRRLPRRRLPGRRRVLRRRRHCWHLPVAEGSRIRWWPKPRARLAGVLPASEQARIRPLPRHWLGRYRSPVPCAGPGDPAVLPWGVAWSAGPGPAPWPPTAAARINRTAVLRRSRTRRLAHRRPTGPGRLPWPRRPCARWFRPIPCAYLPLRRRRLLLALRALPPPVRPWGLPEPRAPAPAAVPASAASVPSDAIMA